MSASCDPFTLAVDRALWRSVGRQAFGGPLFAVERTASAATVETVWGVVVSFDLDADGRSCPAQKTIADLVGLSRWTVNRILLALREAGVTSWEKRLGRRKFKGRRWLFNTYRIPGRERVFLHRRPLLRALDRLRGRLPNTERTTTTSPKEPQGQLKYRKQAFEDYEPLWEEVEVGARGSPHVTVVRG